MAKKTLDVTTDCGALHFSDIERVIVDFFEASGAVTEHQDAEWWVFSGGGLGGAGISLTALALAISQALPQ
jgi:hypothetical protein